MVLLSLYNLEPTRRDSSCCCHGSSAVVHVWKIIISLLSANDDWATPLFGNDRRANFVLSLLVRSQLLFYPLCHGRKELMQRDSLLWQIMVVVIRIIVVFYYTLTIIS